MNQLKREAEPTGYCAEFGENPKLGPSREGNSFPSRSRLFPTSKSKSAGVVSTFVDWVLVTVSVYAEVEIDPQFFIAENEWIFKGLDLFLISTAFLFVKRRANDEKN